MDINKLSERNIVFTHKTSSWDLHLHLIVGEHRNYIVDTGLGADHPREMLAYLASIGNHNPVIAILTHNHWDHIFGNIVFKDGIIIAHKNAYAPMDEYWEQAVEKNRHHLAGAAEKALPNLLFQDELHFPDDDIHLFYTPGHTDDGIAVFDAKERVLNVGDNIGDAGDDIIPWLDESVGIGGFLKSTRRCAALSPEYIIVGHNDIQRPDVFEHIEAAANGWTGNE